MTEDELKRAELYVELFGVDQYELLPKLIAEVRRLRSLVEAAERERGVLRAAMFAAGEDS